MAEPQYPSPPQQYPPPPQQAATTPQQPYQSVAPPPQLPYQPNQVTYPNPNPQVAYAYPQPDSNQGNVYPMQSDPAPNAYYPAAQPHPMYAGLAQPLVEPGQPVGQFVAGVGMPLTPEDEKLQNIRAVNFWFALVLTILLIIGVASTGLWIGFIMVIFLICGIVGAYKLNRCLLIAYMVYPIVTIIFAIIVMALTPFPIVIVAEIISIIISGVALGFDIILVVLVGKRNPADLIVLRSNFKTCCC